MSNLSLRIELTYLAWCESKSLRFTVGSWRNTHPSQMTDR
jgi:hypothetical protein